MFASFVKPHRAGGRKNTPYPAGFAVINEGQGIAVAKNVKIRPNEIVLPASSTIDVSSTDFQTLADVDSYHAATPVDVNAAE